MNISSNKLQLNKFQIECLVDLIQVFQKSEQQIIEFSGQIGKEENWLEIKITPSHAEIWVNSDNAEIVLGNIDGRFEWQDYKNNLDDLRKAFIAEVAKRLKAT